MRPASNHRTRRIIRSWPRRWRMRWTARRVMPLSGSVHGDSCVAPPCSWRLRRSPARRRAWRADAEPTFRKWADDSVRTLRDSRNADARAKAAESLGGYEYPAAVDALQSALRDPDAKVRAAAASALWKTGEPARAARPALVAALERPGARGRDPRGRCARDARHARARPWRPRAGACSTPPAPRWTTASWPRAGSSAPRRRSSLLPPVLDVLERSARPRPSSAQSIDQRQTYESAVHAVDRLARTKDRALCRRCSRPRAAPATASRRCSARWRCSSRSPTAGRRAARLPRRRRSEGASCRARAARRQAREADVHRWAPRAAALLRDPDELVRSEAVWVLGRAGALAAAQVDALVVDAGRRRSGDAPARRRGARRDGRSHAGGHRGREGARRRRRRARSLASLVDAIPMPTCARRRRRRSRASAARAARSRGDTCHAGTADAAGRRRRPAPRQAQTRASAATAAARCAGNAGAEARAVALLRERHIAVEPGAYFQALATTDVDVVRAFLDAGMSATDARGRRRPAAGRRVAGRRRVRTGGAADARGHKRSMNAAARARRRRQSRRRERLHAADGGRDERLRPRRDEDAARGRRESRARQMPQGSPRSTWACSRATTASRS